MPGLGKSGISRIFARRSSADTGFADPRVRRRAGCLGAGQSSAGSGANRSENRSSTSSATIDKSPTAIIQPPISSDGSTSQHSTPAGIEDAGEPMNAIAERSEQKSDMTTDDPQT